MMAGTVPDGWARQADVQPARGHRLWPLYDDLRLITRAPRLLSRERLAAIWRVNMGTDQRQIDRLFYRHVPVYTSGWYPEETGSETTWRWTYQTATLSYPNPKADATFCLDYAARPTSLQTRRRRSRSASATRCFTHSSPMRPGGTASVLPSPRPRWGMRTSPRLGSPWIGRSCRRI